MAAPHRIDVHHHVLPPTYKTRARAQLAAGTSASDDLSFLFDWTPEAALASLPQAPSGSITFPSIDQQTKAKALVAQKWASTVGS